MITVLKSLEEPPELKVEREKGLPALETLIAGRQRRLRSSDFNGGDYTIVSRQLWLEQHRKCCYCEQKIPQPYNDVEHFRPKTVADRRPGSRARQGYWWLAWTWENLLFCCPECNRSYKRERFPLARGSDRLMPGELPPGREVTLLLDPIRDLPEEHIQFVPLKRTGSDREEWYPRPRNRSLKGRESIKILRLDRADLIDRYGDHVEHDVKPGIMRSRASIERGDESYIRETWTNEMARLFLPRCEFLALTRDALRHYLRAYLPNPWDLTVI